jgi:hypothetical protein
MWVEEITGNEAGAVAFGSMHAAHRLNGGAPLHLNNSGCVCDGRTVAGKCRFWSISLMHSEYQLPFL